MGAAVSPISFVDILPVLPVCAACKKIRSKDGVWEQMEVYIEQHSHASFSHGLCPECMPLYMGLDDDN